MFGAEDNPQWRVDPQTGLFVGTYKFEIGKVGLDSRAGWIAFANTRTGHAFAARFPVEPKGEYPDGGADIECWTVGRGQVASLTYDEDDGPFLMEAEVLSPLRDIAPGATTSFDIEWAACRCSAPIVDVTEGGCISQPMSLRRYGAWAKLTAVFGVFDVGQVEFVWLDDHGAPVATQSFGTALPANLVWLDQEVERRADAAQGRLELVTLDNRRLFLAAAPLI